MDCEKPCKLDGTTRLTVFICIRFCLSRYHLLPFSQAGRESASARMQENTAGTSLDEKVKGANRTLKSLRETSKKLFYGL